MDDFIDGRPTIDEELGMLIKNGKKTENEVEEMKQLANQIQMRSTPTSSCLLPGNATIRISLDTELAKVRKDNFDGVDTTHGNWRRTDFGIDHPFPTAKPSERELIPHGLLEVKLATEVGEEPPQWIRVLNNSHLARLCPSSLNSSTATAAPGP